LIYKLPSELSSKHRSRHILSAPNPKLQNQLSFLRHIYCQYWKYRHEKQLIAMNITLFQRTFSLISLTSLAVITSGLSARAENTNFAATDENATSSLQNTEVIITQIESQKPSEDVVKAEAYLDAKPVILASPLMVESTEAQISEVTSETNAPVVAQVGVTPGRATRSGPSYVGIGGNIGISGRTALSRENFTVFSKVGLSRNFSARPAAVIGNRTVFLLPLTLDFPIEQVEEVERLSIAPYIGGGMAISTGRDSRVGPLISGGVDVPVTSNFIATAGVNVGFLRATDIGLLLGVGYAF
jgi:hypothetical protein